ncbi:hypothetical protein NADFUDRAFT_48719 [Nadsonia fulvescens var. elongata DSM 6958]|uniref:Uncharacterized protein n=1 Tax=Nadsonia fulvescens var. elongata DSM 6958 TaxID=857566 RepID=A0A1E3PRL6_9ASCO|nr:hypothetical protein NADFUDRAFT_48719 [Nadsonia fulvescens var. elongata DSM 6958]
MSLTYTDLNYLNTVGPIPETSLITSTTCLENVDIDRALEKLGELDKKILTLRFALPNLLRNLANITEGDVASQVFYQTVSEAKTLKLEVDTFVSEYGQCKPLFDLVNNWKSSLQTDNIFGNYGNQPGVIGSFDNISGGIDFNDGFNSNQNNNFITSKGSLPQAANSSNDNRSNTVSLNANNNTMPMADSHFTVNRRMASNTPVHEQRPIEQDNFGSATNNIGKGDIRKVTPANSAVNSPNFTNGTNSNHRNFNSSTSSHSQVNSVNDGLNIMGNGDFNSNRINIPSSSSPEIVNVDASMATGNKLGGIHSIRSTNGNATGSLIAKDNNLNLAVNNYSGNNNLRSKDTNKLLNVKDVSNGSANMVNMETLKGQKNLINNVEVFDNNAIGPINGINKLGDVDISSNKTNNYNTADINSLPINTKDTGIIDISSTDLNVLGNINGLNDNLVDTNNARSGPNSSNVSDNSAMPSNNLNLGMSLSPQQSSQSKQTNQGAFSDQYNNQQFLNGLGDMSFMGAMNNLDQTIKFNDPTLSFMNL